MGLQPDNLLLIFFISSIQIYFILPLWKLFVQPPVINIELSNLQVNIELSNLQVNIELSNLQVNLELSNLQLNIELSNLQVNLELSNLQGNMELSNLQLNIELSNLQGNIELSNLQGNIELSNLQLNIELSNLQVNIELSNLLIEHSNQADWHGGKPPWVRQCYNTLSFIVFAVYRPPAAANDWNEWKWFDKVLRKRLKDITKTFQMTQMINKPIRITKSSQTNKLNHWSLRSHSDTICLKADKVKIYKSKWNGKEF